MLYALLREPLSRALEAVAITPVAWPSSVMCYGDENPFLGSFEHHDIVGESLKDQALDVFREIFVHDGKERNGAVFYEINGGFQSFSELRPQPGTLILIPSRRLSRFLGGLLEEPYRNAH